VEREGLRAGVKFLLLKHYELPTLVGSLRLRLTNVY